MTVYQKDDDASFVNERNPTAAKNKTLLCIKFDDTADGSLAYRTEAVGLVSVHAAVLGRAPYAF